MPPPFHTVTAAQFSDLLGQFPFLRRIQTLTLQDISDEDEFSPSAPLVNLWRNQTSEPIGWDDIAAHLVVAPDGSLYLGRNWNTPSPALPTLQSPGNFLIARYPGKGTAKAQQQAVKNVVAAIQNRFQLPDSSVVTDVGKSALATEDEMLEMAMAEMHTPKTETPPSVDELTRSLLRAAPRPVAPEADLSEMALSFPLISSPPRLTIDEKESLLPHVINLSRGKFSDKNEYSTSEQEVDAIFNEHLEAAMQGHSTDNPLKIVIWAHGGLVNERVGLHTAHRHILWWQKNGVYPLYFVWETGIYEALSRLLLGQSGGEEAFIGGILDAAVEFSDQKIEQLARLIDARAIWSDIKQTAFLANAEDGGAFYAAQQLAALCKRHKGAVELHAVGHSAGSNFLSVFLPVLLKKHSLHLKNLFFLAPAMRIDQFQKRLLPLIGKDKQIARLSLFTMNKLRENDDNCMGLYRKSLLVLIYNVLEDEQEAPLMGLEMCLRRDEAMKAFFGLGGADASKALGEVIWSKTSAIAPPRSRSASIHHGDFDDDAPTMDSILRRVLDRDEIEHSYTEAE